MLSTSKTDKHFIGYFQGLCSPVFHQSRLVDQYLLVGRPFDAELSSIQENNISDNSSQLCTTSKLD